MHKPNMKILWFTDLHFRTAADPEAETMFQRFERSLAHALAHHADADLCIFTGDIAHSGQAEEYAGFKRAMTGFPLPYRVLMGNHDDRHLLSQMLDLPLSPRNTLVGSETLGDYRLITLDTHRGDGRDDGHIHAGDLAWLDEELTAGERPALIFMHHQPGPVFIPSSDTIGLDNAAALQALLQRHRHRIAHLFHGHCHLPISGSLNGIAYTGLPAIGPQQSPNFASTDFIADPGAPPCYGVIVADPSSLACHLITVR
ncbi:MAG TPA: metallophosphoesterase [Devosiaceae bacterium]|jgi:3',5'-cyclic AMP phosphodiesterase CpdA